MLAPLVVPSIQHAPHIVSMCAKMCSKSKTASIKSCRLVRCVACAGMLLRAFPALVEGESKQSRHARMAACQDAWATLSHRAQVGILLCPNLHMGLEWQHSCECSLASKLPNALCGQASLLPAALILGRLVVWGVVFQPQGCSCTRFPRSASWLLCFLKK